MQPRATPGRTLFIAQRSQHGTSNKNRIREGGEREHARACETRSGIKTGVKVTPMHRR